MKATLSMLQHAQRISGDVSQTCRFFGVSRRSVTSGESVMRNTEWLASGTYLGDRTISVFGFHLRSFVNPSHSGSVRGVAGPGRTVDRAGRAAHHRDDSGKRSDAARGTAVPAGSGVGCGALGTPAGLRGVWRTEGGRRASAGAHAGRTRSGIGQLRAVAARRGAAARTWWHAASIRSGATCS